MNKIKLLIFFLMFFAFNSDALANPQQYNSYIQKAYKALNSGNYQAAIQNYKNALRFYSNDADIYNNLGVAYSKTNDLNNAELNYKKAIQLEPSNAFAYSNLSGIYEKKQKYSEAAKTLENYAKLTPSDKDVYYHLGYLYSKAGNKELSLKNYEKSIPFTSNKFDTYCAMGDICKKSGGLNKAIFYYEKALSVNNTQENENLPYVLQELRECQFKSAITSLNPVIKAPPVLYNLVRTNSVLKYSDNFDKVYEMLDLLWNDDDGRILLNKVIERKIPIQITFGGKDQTNAYIEESSKITPLGYLGMVPMPLVIAAPLALSNALFHTDVKKEKKITVNLGEDIIQKYKNPKSSYHDNMYALMTVMHELGHAVSSLIEDKHKNSLEEEVTVSMIGYNSASKIFMGRPLTTAESIQTAKNTYKALMSDEHRNLPLYNNYKNTISKIGVNLYNYDTYADLYKLQQ
ncbi:MAG TPA: hypothetical protein DDW90_09890 [Cyanobacteria bacterium UBA9971]|nr:hypothetical protein [Cyanobacteria bacterium UBA9971]